MHSNNAPVEIFRAVTAPVGVSPIFLIVLFFEIEVCIFQIEVRFCNLKFVNMKSGLAFPDFSFYFFGLKLFSMTRLFTRL